MAVRNLRDVRNARRFVQKQVARQMGIAQSRVSAIEHDPIGSLQVSTLARYLESMGGELRMYVQFPGWEIVLDWRGDPVTEEET